MTSSKAGARIVPHFWHATEAEEAARFSASIFPDSLLGCSSIEPTARSGSGAMVTHI